MSFACSLVPRFPLCEIENAQNKMAEQSWLDLVLYYGLFIGGIFQLICILAIVFIPPSTFVKDEEILEEREANQRKFNMRPQASQQQARERKKRR